MDDVDDQLARLRREIDGIDSQIHDLLMRRTDLAVSVGEVKARLRPVGRSFADGATFIRPAREANILRRLVRRHRGPLPRPVIVRLWREIISALLQVEGPFAVAVFSPGDQPGFWDLARDHYGTRVQIQAFADAERVLDAVRRGAATVGILPLPDAAEERPWWPMLMDRNAGWPHVMGRLPFGDCGNQRGGPSAGLVVGYAANEPSGEDCSLLALKRRAGVDHGLLLEAVVTVEPCARVVSVADGKLSLLELGGLWSDPAPTIEAALAKVAERTCVIGGYAAPFSEAELRDLDRGT
jgi:chorismate mutase-like protein